MIARDWFWYFIKIKIKKALNFLRALSGLWTGLELFLKTPDIKGLPRGHFFTKY